MSGHGAGTFQKRNDDAYVIELHSRSKCGKRVLENVAEQIGEGPGNHSLDGGCAGFWVICQIKNEDEGQCCTHPTVTDGKAEEDENAIEELGLPRLVNPIKKADIGFSQHATIIRLLLVCYGYAIVRYK